MYGIGVLNPKYGINIGTLIRSAYIEGANFVFTIGRRYKKQKSDRGYTGQIPVFHFDTFEAFRNGIPQNLQLVLVEINVGGVVLPEYSHPKNAVYLLGAEDDGIANELLKASIDIIELPGKACHNVAVTGSIVMYDRSLKRNNI